MTQRTEPQLSTLVSLAAMINSSLDPHEVRRQAIIAATSLLDAEAGSLFLLDETSGELFFEIALGAKGPEVQGARLKRGEGIAGWVVEHGEPLLVSDAQQDQRFCRAIDARSRFMTRTVVCVPVTVKGRVIGALQALNKKAGSFTLGDQAALVALANQVAIALENARLYEENTSHLSEIIGQERRHRQEKERLVKDLHDGIGGIATNINLLVEIARRSGDLSGRDDTLGTIAELSRELMGELRSFMNTLESRELTWQELAAEIRRHGTTMLVPHDITFRFTAELADPSGGIGIFLYLTLLRIAKEALANVVKHAGAADVVLTLSVNPQRCAMEIIDNGCGLAGATRVGRGLRNMRSRSAELNGELTVVSPPGTRISLCLPLPFTYLDPDVATFAGDEP